MSIVRYSRRKVVVFGLFFTFAIATFVFGLDHPKSPLFIDCLPNSWRNPTNVNIAIVAVILAGMGLGSLVALVRENRHGLRAVLRPGKGQVASAVILALLVPIVPFGLMPFTLLFPVAEFWVSLFVRQMEITAILPSLAILVAILPFTYVISSFIISGFRSRLRRVALFGQIWLGWYGAVLLIFGYEPLVL